MNNLVIGMGEVGNAVYEVTGSSHSYDIDHVESGQINLIPVGIMHVCFPYSETFVSDVQGYIARYNPRHILIWSTVPIGTCRKIDERVCHTPVEGVHPHLAESISKMRRWIGYNRGEEGRFFEKYFARDLGMDISIVRGTETTELLKLRSTAKYGINIAWAQYEQELCDKYGVSFDSMMGFDQDYNKLYSDMGLFGFSRYILYPPDGEIGGHCIVPNAKMLNEQLPNELLDKIIEMEKK